MGFSYFFRVPNIQGPLGPSLYIPSQSKNIKTHTFSWSIGFFLFLTKIPPEVLEPRYISQVMGALTMLIPTNTPNHPPSTVHATSLRRFGKVNWQLSLWSSIGSKGCVMMCLSDIFGDPNKRIIHSVLPLFNLCSPRICANQFFDAANTEKSTYESTPQWHCTENFWGLAKHAALLGKPKKSVLDSGTVSGLNISFCGKRCIWMHSEQPNSSPETFRMRAAQFCWMRTLWIRTRSGG